MHAQPTWIEALVTKPHRYPVAGFFSDPVRAYATISPDGTRIAYLAPENGLCVGQLFANAENRVHALEAECAFHARALATADRSPS